MASDRAKVCAHLPMFHHCSDGGARVIDTPGMRELKIGAVAAGDLDERRLTSDRKLQREAALAPMTTRERRARDRHFGRIASSAMGVKKKDKR